MATTHTKIVQSCGKFILYSLSLYVKLLLLPALFRRIGIFRTGPEEGNRWSPTPIVVFHTTF